jgi:aryl-alcohol dehydrogenase-like predicted oxidoreductase
MEQRSLGNTGLKVSLLSFGCVEIGIPYGIGVRDREDMLPEAQAVALLQGALARGVTFYDTAPSYGASEALLGRAFEACRSQVVICTKCPGLTGDDGRVLRKRLLRDRILGSLDASLRALRTDYVDVLMLHRVEEALIANDEVAGILEDLLSQRAIRAKGASTYPGGITGRVIASRRWQVLQVAFSLVDQREVGFLAAAEAAGVGVVARSVLLKGILTDRGRELHPALKPVQAHRERCVAETPAGMTLSAFATRFAMGRRGVGSVLVGIDRPEYLDQAVALAEAGALAPEDDRRALGLAYPEPDFIDLPAWHARGWLT